MAKTINSLQEYDDITSRIKHGSQVNLKPKVLVEGYSDQVVLKDHLENVEFFVCGSKSVVLNTIKELDDFDYGVAPYVGIYDQDFDNDNCTGSHFCPYEFRDLECMLIRNGLPQKLLDFYGAPDKLRDFNYVRKVLAGIEDAAIYVGLLRSANVQNRWGVKFKEIDLSKKFNKKTLSIKRDALIDAVIAKAEYPIEPQDVRTALQDLDVSDLGPRGKDYLVFLGAVLVRELGTLKGQNVTEDMMVRNAHSLSYSILRNCAWLDAVNHKLSENI